MFKRIMPLFLTALLICTFTAYAADSEDEVAAGFDYPVGYTESKNEYYFQSDMALAVINKEVDGDPVYEWLPPGTQILLPIYVYQDDSRNAVPATDKMIKNDNVTVSSKIMTGKSYVGEITLVDGKKLKLNGVDPGMYVSIPLSKNYDKAERTAIRANFVLSANDVTYDLTEVKLKCYIRNQVTFIDHNTVYGAKTPTQFKVDKLYNGEATFDFGNKVKYTVRVKGLETYYMNLDKTPDSNIKEMYPDAYLDFYNFLGDLDAFKSNGTLEIPINRSNLGKKGENAELYAYKIQNDKLVALGTGIVSFDAKNDKLFIKTSKLENYVLSSRALAQNISASPDSNILKSGYANLASSETSQVSGAPAPQTAAQTTTRATSQAAAAQTAARSPSTAAIDTDTDDNGYVPEETGYYNDNVNTGLPINASNISSDNPSTSENTFLPASFACLAFSFAAFIGLRKRR